MRSKFTTCRVAVLLACLLGVLGCHFDSMITVHYHAPPATAGDTDPRLEAALEGLNDE